MLYHHYRTRTRYFLFQFRGRLIQVANNMENSSCKVGTTTFVLNMTSAFYTNDSVIVSNDKYANLLEQTETALFVISFVLAPVTITGNLMVQSQCINFVAFVRSPICLLAVSLWLTVFWDYVLYHYTHCSTLTTILESISICVC